MLQYSKISKLRPRGTNRLFGCFLFLIIKTQTSCVRASSTIAQKVVEAKFFMMTDSLNKLIMYGKINEWKKWKCKELKWSKKCEAHHSLNKLVLYGKINE